MISRFLLLLLAVFLSGCQGQNVGMQSPIYSIQTIAGAAPGVNGNPGAFLSPVDMGYSSGYMYVTEVSSNVVRKVALDGTMTTIGN